MTATIAIVPPNTGTPDAGTVTFMDGSTSLGSAPVNAGTATLIATSLTAGTHVLTADYNGFGSGFADSRSDVGANSVITTIAGNGSTTYGGDGGAATAAMIYRPQAVAVDSNGNVFIADSGNQRVRRIDASTGIITTVAGNGIAGFGGDNGPATGASLSWPMGVAVDTNGHLFIADKNNYRIREVDLSTGIITTVAGNGTSGFGGDNGLATAAILSSLTAIAVNSNGNFYIANGNRIRKVTISTGVITTVAGNGNYGFGGDGGLATGAMLKQPAAVAVDGNGNIFIADSYNERIRKVTASTGVISTVAGTGTYGYGGDGGLATAAMLEEPAGVAVDNNGNIFIADSYDHRIRKVTVSTGMIATIAGNGTAGYGGDGGLATAAMLSYPRGLALDATGHLLVCDFGLTSNLVRKIDLSPGTIRTVAGDLGDNGLGTATALNFPNSVSTDANGNLFIVDYQNNRVRMVNPSTDVITGVAGNGTQGFAGDNGPATAASLYSPWGIAVDGSGNVFIADSANNCIREVNHSTGVITTVAGNGTAGYSGDNGPATGASLDDPYGVATDATGHLYISDHLNNRIRCVNLSTHIITTVAGNGTGGFGGDGGQATAALLGSPSGIALDASGNLFIADQWNRRIREVNLSTGIISTVAGNGDSGYSGDNGPATAASFCPWGIAVDTSGHLFIADYSHNRIREVDLATGIITTVVGDGVGAYSGDNGPAATAEINDPLDVAVDSQGNLFIADSQNNRVREVTPGWLLTITQATSNTLVTASASPSAYGQSVTFTATATPSGSVNPTGTVQFKIDGSNAGSPVTLAGGMATYSTSALAVGNHSVVAVYSGDSNFTAGTSPSFNQSVGQATPTIAWSTPAPITYGTALSSTQLNAGASVGGTYSYGPGLGTVLQAGTQTLLVTFTPADTTDYSTATATVNVNVSPALLVASVAIGDKCYDGTVTATITGRSLSGVLGSDDVSLTGGAASFGDKNVGASKLVIVSGLNLTGADADNYAFSTGAATANITPALLTVTADDKARACGDPNPTFTATYTGFVNGETPTTSGVTGVPNFDCIATTTSPVGKFPITPTLGTLVAKNYDFTYVNGTLTVMLITPAALMVAEYQPVHTTVGTLSTADPDVGNTFTYTLVSGAGSTDNTSFIISGNVLETAAVFNYYGKQNVYSVRVRSTDRGGLYVEEPLTVKVLNLNQAPTGIALSNSSVAENQPVGTTVGTLFTIDPDIGDTHFYRLVAGAGSADNASFTIDGDVLKTAAIFNYAVKRSYSIRIRSTDQGGLYVERVKTITVTHVHQAPTNIGLSNSSVAENQPAGTTVGTLSTTDPDVGNTFTYTLVSGAGSTDNAKFTISGNVLKTAAVFDYELKKTYTIRIRSTDQGGLWVEKTKTITVTNLADPLVIVDGIFAGWNDEL